MSLFETFNLENNHGLCTVKTLNNTPLYLFFDKTKTKINQFIRTIKNNYSCVGGDYDERKLKYYCEELQRELHEFDLYDHDMQFLMLELNLPPKFTIKLTLEENPDLTKRKNIETSHASESQKSKENNASNDWTGQIFVKTLSRNFFTLNAHAKDSIKSIKQQIKDKCECPIDQQRLLFCGQQLEDNKTLIDYYVIPSSILHFVQRLSGGMYQETSGKAGNYQPLKSIVLFINCESRQNIIALI